MSTTRAKKSLGQNFLQHPQIAERIVHAAQLPENATVLEIGPGTGILTRALLNSDSHVIAVEADVELIPGLEEKFAAEIALEKLTLVHEDIRSFDSSSLPKGYVLVANIPYYITGEIIRAFLTAAHKPASMTLLVQKEVAERIARQTGPRPKGGLLSLSVKAYGIPKYCFMVPRGAFRPAPNVDSAVISIRDIRQDAFKSPQEEELFFNLLRTGFAHKRKMLFKNLELLFKAEELSAAFNAVPLPKNIRPEELSLADWQKLAKQLT